MSLTTEHTFESSLVQSLVEQGGYTLGNSEDYSRELGLFNYEVIRFLRQSQENPWENIKDIHPLSWISTLVVNCFQNCTLRGKSQRIIELLYSVLRCELLSKLYLKGEITARCTASRWGSPL